jgi:hypothetical protein
VVLSTAHKAKGREWDAVRIGGDFMPRRGPRARGPEPRRGHADVRRGHARPYGPLCGLPGLGQGDGGRVTCEGWTAQQWAENARYWYDEVQRRQDRIDVLERELREARAEKCDQDHTNRA